MQGWVGLDPIEEASVALRHQQTLQASRYMNSCAGEIVFDLACQAKPVAPQSEH